MRFLQNIKTKLRKTVKYTENRSVSWMPQEDIDMLASMCMMCVPVVKQRKFIFSKYYSYFVTSPETEINIAKSIFEKSGIHMHVHYSGIVSGEEREVLRTDFEKYESRDAKRIMMIMEKIENNYIYLYSPQGKQKRQELSRKLNELHQNQK